MAQAMIGQCTEEQGFNTVPFIEIIIEKKKVGQRCSEIIDLRNGLTFFFGESGKLEQALTGCLFIPEFAKCQSLKIGGNPWFRQSDAGGIPMLASQVLVAGLLRGQSREVIEIALQCQ